MLAKLIRLAPHGQHVAIEPIRVLASNLARRFPRVDVLNAVAGDERRKVDFQVVLTNPAFSGIRRREDLDPREIVETVEVQALRLDDVVRVGMPIDLIKIDVEGAELQVLLGARRLLDCGPVVLFEHGGASAIYGTTSQDVFDELASHGLGVWLMGDWLAGRPALSAADFAAIAAGGDVWNFIAAPTRPRSADRC